MVFLIIASFSVYAETDTLIEEWIVEFDVDHDNSRDMKIGPEGNIYVLGETGTTIGWVPNDIYLIKYDSLGGLVWQQNIPNSNYARAITLDSTGNVYVLGNNADPYFAIIAKYDSEGNQQWVTQYNSPYPVEHVKRIVFDSENNIFISLQSNPNYLGGDQHIILVKFDNQGNELWSRDINTRYYGFPDRTFYEDVPISIDSEDNLVLGKYKELGFGTNDLEMFLIKYSPGGTTLWDYTNGILDNEDIITDIVIDSLDNIYITGFSSSFSFVQPKFVFTSKFDSEGNLQWTKKFNIDLRTQEYAESIDLDPNENIVVSGRYDGENGIDTFLVKYDPDGNLIWTNTYEGLYGNDWPTEMEFDNESIYLTGSTEGSDGYYDRFILKYNNQQGSLEEEVIYDSNVIGVGVPFMFANRHTFLEIDSSEDCIYSTGNYYDLTLPMKEDIHTIKYCQE